MNRSSDEKFPSFHQDEYRNSSPASARYHIIPVPYEATVSYGGGTSQGPPAIIEASRQLETIIEGAGEPGIYGIHTAAPIDCTVKRSPRELFSRIARAMDASWEQGSVPILLGGEHSITNGAIEAISSRFPPGEAGILQFDAHMDLRDTYQGSSYSHASVMRRALQNGLALFQVGIRSYSEEEVEIREHHCICSLDASYLHRGRRSEHMCLPDGFPPHVYITFDVDVFDASLMPATGTPEPGGLFWWDTVDLLSRLLRGRTVIGADVVELAPRKELHHCSYTAAKLTYYLMGLAAPGLSPAAHL